MPAVEIPGLRRVYRLTDHLVKPLRPEGQDYGPAPPKRLSCRARHCGPCSGALRTRTPRWLRATRSPRYRETWARIREVRLVAVGRRTAATDNGGSRSCTLSD